MKPFRSWPRAASSAAWLAVVLVAGAAQVAAQDVAPDLNEELRRLRDAAAYEASGDYAAAEHVLQSLLRTHPTSLNALLSLERILALEGRLAEILPAVDTLLLRDPSSVIGHQIRTRTFSTLNRVDDLEFAAEDWIRSSPTVETPYREIARLWRARGEWERAVRTLERGRDRVSRRDALALELGDAYAQAGDDRRVVREWSRAIGPRGEAFMLVHRRLASLPGGGASVSPGLVDALRSRPTTPDRMRAAIQLAIDAGLQDKARETAAAVIGLLKETEKPGFLVELGRRADGAGLKPLALWAYGAAVRAGEQAGKDGHPALMLALRSRVAELALAVGDTAMASEMYREAAGFLAPGSPEKRQALALRVQLLAREGAHDSARAELARLTDESTGAPEVDVAAAALANALIDAGRPDDAEEVLAAGRGPHTTFARGRVFMTRGDVARARNAILAAAPQLDGVEATEALGLATLLGRLSARGGELVGQAVAATAAGDRREGVRRLYDGSEKLPEGERAAILDFAATMAESTGLDAEAEQIRRDIVTETPHAPEAPEALLALARGRLTRSGPDEARLLLERLIVDYPRSALVPQAQRELERLAPRRYER